MYIQSCSDETHPISFGAPHLKYLIIHPRQISRTINTVQYKVVVLRTNYEKYIRTISPKYQKYYGTCMKKRQHVGRPSNDGTVTK